jgi:O-antigen/teichoic acid export membrane protein
MNRNSTHSSQRVVINTAILYVRLLVVMVIGLFTTRLVLDALGEINYGIYTLVGGMIGMLAFLQGAMTAASMRYLAHSLGTTSTTIQIKTFNSTLFLHIIFASLIVIILEIGGLVMFKYYINIPSENIYSAKIIFQFMVMTSFVSIISVPYDAVINAHENMTFLAIVDILGSILKLVLAIYLAFTNYNVLIIYGLFIFVIQVTIRIIKQIYSRKKYNECKINFYKHINKKVVYSMLTFSGWNLLGSFSSMLIGQFRSVLVNMFFGVRLNAAQGVANGLSGQVNNVANSLTRAIRPQLIKSEGSGDRVKMLAITGSATKFSIFLFSIIAIPVILDTPYLLQIWLKEVPEYSIIFCRLILIGVFTDKFTFEIGTAISAAGNIRTITVVESLTIILSVFVTYILFKMGFPPHTLYVVPIGFNFILFFERLIIGRISIGLDISNFLKISLKPILIPILFSILIAIIPYAILDQSFLRFSLSFILSAIVLIITFRYYGLTKNEFTKLERIAIEILNKLKITQNKLK